MPLDGHIGQECLYFLGSHGRRMAQLVIADASNHPEHIGLFGTIAVLVLPEPKPELIHQLYWFCRKRARDVIHDNSLLFKMTV